MSSPPVQKPDTLLISSEHLYCRLHQRFLIARFKELLDPYVEEFKILVYFRRQDRVAVSLLSTRVKSGHKRLGGILPQPDQPQFRNYNYFKKFLLWESVFGKDAMCSRIYEDSLQGDHSIISDFCAATGINADGKRIPKQMNPSLSRQGVHFLRALNEVMPKPTNGQVDFERASLVQDVVELYKGKHTPLNRQRAQNFYKQFKSSNEQLRKRAFPKKESPIFDDDFSDYPEKATNTPPDYVEAVEVAVALWRRARYKSSPVGFFERALQFVRRKR